MGKINLHAPFAGVKDALTLLTLLQDKKKLKEILGVVKALEDERQALNEAIEVYGKASKMDVLLRNVQQKDQEAAVALREAKENAGQTQKDAKTWADDLRGKLVEREKVVTVLENTVVKDRSLFNTDRDTWQAALAEAKAEIAKREQTTARLLDEAKALKNRYETALASMKAGAAAA